MFEYYTILLIITTSIIISGLVVVYYDDILEKVNRNIFFISYIMILIVYPFEWLSVYLERTNSSLHLLTTFSMSVVLFLAPSIIAVFTLGVNEQKSNLLTKIVISIIALSFIIGFSGLFSDAIFYYDEQNIYHRGNYFFVHTILAIISAITLFINTLRLGIHYQAKNNLILFLDFFLFIGALFVQFTFNGVWILWITCIIGIGFGYIYYSTLVNQIDVLTGLLNRKCYDSRLYDIKSDAVILFFDVNKFKEINDTLGHEVGDYCLIEISKAIKKTYGKSGHCYRIGGDEFSVILNKNLEQLEDFNFKFSKLLSEKDYKQKLPTVSIGFSHYYPNKSSIQEVIEEADRMMYIIKQAKSGSDITQG